jgi:hypothetical protein
MICFLSNPTDEGEGGCMNEGGESTKLRLSFN